MAKIKYPTESKITLNISNFEKGLDTSLSDQLSSPNSAKILYNFSFAEGTLKKGLGFADLIAEFSTPETIEALKRDFEDMGSIERVFHFYLYDQDKNQRQDKLVFVNDQLKLFYINLYDTQKSLIQIRNIAFTSLPVAVRYRLNGEDVIILSSESDNMVVWNGKDDPYEVLDAPKISSMALHYERLFATVDREKNAVWFSDDLDPTNWSLSLDEAGFIELVDERGALLKVVSFCDYIYIFREYGISRLTAFGDQNNFAVSNLFVSSGKIYADSVCVCGDKILFMASDGIYKFDGVETIKILDGITKNISQIAEQKASACYYNGNYYLACKFNFFDGDDCHLKNSLANALLEIDATSYKLKNLTHSIQVKYLTSILSESFEGVIALTGDYNDNTFYLARVNNSGQYFDKNFIKHWTSPTFTISNLHNQKTLRKVYVDATDSFQLDLVCDDVIHSYVISNSKRPSVLRVNIPLNKFCFRIYSVPPEVEIRGFKFEFSSVKGRE